MVDVIGWPAFQATYHPETRDFLDKGYTYTFIIKRLITKITVIKYIIVTIFMFQVSEVIAGTRQVYDRWLVIYQ